MRAKLNESEISKLCSIQNRLITMRDDIEKNDVELNHGNGAASGQIDCAIASLECILQEYF